MPKSQRTKKRRPRARPKAAAIPAAPSGEHIEIIARGCLVHGSRVLLCRNLKHGYLYLPGGHVEFGESAAAALAREFLEECAVKLRVGDLALVSEGRFQTHKRQHHEINLVFHVEQVGGPKPEVLRSREDAIGFEWVELAAVPETDIRPLAVKAWLAAGSSESERVIWVSEMD